MESGGITESGGQTLVIEDNHQRGDKQVVMNGHVTYPITNDGRQNDLENENALENENCRENGDHKNDKHCDSNGINSCNASGLHNVHNENDVSVISSVQDDSDGDQQTNKDIKPEHDSTIIVNDSLNATCNDDTHKHTDNHTHKHTDNHTHKHTDKHTHKHTDNHTHKHTDNHTHKHTNNDAQLHHDTTTTNNNMVNLPVIIVEEQAQYDIGDSDNDRIISDNHATVTTTTTPNTTDANHHTILQQHENFQKPSVIDLTRDDHNSVVTDHQDPTDNDRTTVVSDHQLTTKNTTEVTDHHVPSDSGQSTAVTDHQLPTDKDNSTAVSDMDNSNKNTSYPNKDNTSPVRVTDNDVSASTPSNCHQSQISFHDEKGPESQSGVATVNPGTDNPSPDHRNNGIYNHDNNGSNNADQTGEAGLNDKEPTNPHPLFLSQGTSQESSVDTGEGSLLAPNHHLYYRDHGYNDGIKAGCCDSTNDAVDCDSDQEVSDFIPKAVQSNNDSGVNCDNENGSKGQICEVIVTSDHSGETKTVVEDFVSPGVEEEKENVDKSGLESNQTKEPVSDPITHHEIVKTRISGVVPLSPTAESEKNKTSLQESENAKADEEFDSDSDPSNKVEPPIIQTSEDRAGKKHEENAQSVREGENKCQHNQKYPDYDDDHRERESLEKSDGCLLEENNTNGIKNSPENSHVEPQHVEEIEQGEDLIDRDRITAFVNEITHKAVVTYSQNIPEDGEGGDNIANVWDVNQNSGDDLNEAGINELRPEHSKDVSAADDNKTEPCITYEEDFEKIVDIDEEIEKNPNQNSDQKEILIQSESPFNEEGDSRKIPFNSSGPEVQEGSAIRQPILQKDCSVDDTSGPVVRVCAGQTETDHREYNREDHSDASSISSTLSSNENMEDDTCRPRNRPKSSHHRKRGQQDTDQEGIPHARLSPNQRQTKIHKNEQDERTDTPTDLHLNDLTGDVNFDQQNIEVDEQNRENIPPGENSQETGNMTKKDTDYDDDDKEMDGRLSALPSAQINTSGIGWAEPVSPSPSSQRRQVGDDPGKMDASRISLTSGDRISRISDAADNISYMQNSLQEMFREAKGILSDFQSQLKDQPISEFSQDVPEFNRAFTSLSDAYRACEHVTGGINEQLAGIRTMTNEICDLITHKASSQGLNQFVHDDVDESSGKELSLEQKEAIRKEQQARLQEIKAITAKATAQAQTAYELAAQAEAEATQAEVAATNARQEAEVAMKRIEEAKVAAERRRLEEEERKRIAEENARKKAEEERRRKEEEERRIAQEAKKKGTSLEEERRRAQEEKARLEAERKNPNNWPRYIYSIDGGDWNPGVGLILRAQQGCLDREDLQITLVDPMENCLPLGENEELISNIVSLTAIDKERVFKFEEAMSVSIPHCCPRYVPGREPVVKLMTSDGKLSILHTHDLIFDDIKELKFAEVRMRQFGTMAVFLRPKKEQLTLNRMGGKVMSGVDSRVTITSCENAFKTNITFTMEVQPIDQNLVLELKTKKPLECGDLMSTSPLVTFIMKSQFHKPLTLTLPCPHNPALRPRRPQTAGNRLPSPTTDKKESTERPLSARPFFSGKDETDVSTPDQVHLLRKDGGGSWYKADDVDLTQTKKKDVVTFDMVNPFNKLVLIRTKAGLTIAQVERILGHVVMALTFKPVSVVMRQKTSDPNCVTVTCAHSSGVDRVIKSLQEEGYDHGPKPSPDIYLTEGQRLALQFRGNLILMDEFSRSNFLFYNHIPFRLTFTVTEQDKYAQKGFDSYRGFSQIFTKGKVRKPSMAVDDRDRMTGQRVKDELMDGNVLLCEHLIIIPKPDPETPRPLNVAPVSLSSDGVVNDEMLRFLSTHLQNNDWKKVACMLNVKRSRIQAILRQNINNSTPQTVYDVLVSWSKRLPRAVNRTDILCSTLSTVGRDDLAEELRVRDEEYRQARTAKARESYLRKAFIAIARNPLAVTQWKYLARYLDVDDEEINQIEATTNGCQESCLATLSRWKESKGDEATIPLLATKLRRCRYRRLAREIEDIR